MVFSPLQVGFLANDMKPVPIDAYAKVVLDLFLQNDGLEVVPVTDSKGCLLGVVPRGITKNYAISAAYREYQKDLKDFLIPLKGVLDARSFISRVVDENLKQDQGEFPAWFEISYNDRSLGVVSLQYMLEYINTLRSRDMENAGAIQKKLLGESLYRTDHFSLLFCNKMAHEIGGDYYHVFSCGAKRYLVGCFDVSGKNVAGSMATMALGACFSTLELFKYPESPSRITGLLNSLVKDVSPLGHYVTALLFHIDFATEILEIHNCGFSPVSVFKPLDNGKIGFKIMSPALPPLGLEEDFAISERQTVPISKGLRLGACSDGLPDMVNKSGERYGEKRSLSFIKAMHARSQEEMETALQREVEEWTHETALVDDLTLLDLRFT
ncbi:MAG: serine/threonine-protein phosphatase [Treponema sp.]|jgi:sigma-B regulation protein RsbU (phosphoserine phosphatase)|nr:serine/threonine-protein phosphatase [Treponema sp.]